MSHLYVDDDGEQRECGDEGTLCPACETTELCYWASYFGVSKRTNVNARHLSESKDEAERIEAECKEAGRP